MLNALDSMYLGVMIWFSNFMDDLKNDEAGVSSIVATVLLILIVVLLAAMFWDYISDWFDTTWQRITGAADGIN